MTYAVKFGAEWCGPCVRFEPVLARVVEENNAEIYDVDVDETDPDVLREWGVVGIPATFILDDDDEIVDQFSGPVSHAVLTERMGL